MFDQFILDHRELDWQQTAKRPDLSGLLAHLREHPPASVDPPIDLLLRVCEDLDLFETFIRQRLKHHVWNPRLDLIEQNLLEFIELHLLQEALEKRMMDKVFLHESRAKANRAIKALGVLIQQRLTLLLTELNPEDYPSIYTGIRFEGMNFEEWKASIRGAASVARVLKVLTSSGWKKRIFLATLEEDLSLGTDLIVLPGKMSSVALAVAVGSNRGETDLTCEVLNGGLEGERVVRGAKILQNRYPSRTWKPVQFEVGRHHWDRSELEIHRREVGAFERFMEQLHT